MSQVVVFWKNCDNPLLPLLHSHSPESIFPLPGFTPNIRKWIWVVTVEPQVTHLETPICVGHSTLLTYFLPFLLHTFPPLERMVPFYLPMKQRQQRDFKLPETESFWSDWHFRWVLWGKKKKKRRHLGCRSHFYFMLSSGLTQLQTRGSVFPMHPQMKSTLKTEGAVGSCRNRKQGEENPAWAKTSELKPIILISSHAPYLIWTHHGKVEN